VRQLRTPGRRGPADLHDRFSVVGHRTSVGTAHAGTTVTAIRDGNRATVYDPHGRPLGHLHLDPDNTYVTLTRAA
jgi:hypothetical protein